MGGPVGFGLRQARENENPAPMARGTPPPLAGRSGGRGTAGGGSGEGVWKRKGRGQRLWFSEQSAVTKDRRFPTGRVGGVERWDCTGGHSRWVVTLWVWLVGLDSRGQQVGGQDVDRRGE